MRSSLQIAKMRARSTDVDFPVLWCARRIVIVECANCCSVMSAAARVGDTTSHGTPLVGTGCPTVLIGGRPAWRSVVPASGGGAASSAVAAFQSAQSAARQAIEAAKLATVAAFASGVPGAGPAAKAAEEALKAATAAAMSAAATAAAASIAAAAGAPPDVTTCPVPLPIPPHGPGMVTAGSTTVFIGGYGAARMGDPIVEAIGPPNTIAGGDGRVAVG